MRPIPPIRRAALAVVAAIPALFLPAAAPALTPLEQHALLNEGNTLFRQANDAAARDPQTAKDLYRKAILRFERLTREGGVHNGRLFYNVGNAYFRMEDLGRAILNYRRAAELIPNDPNLVQNLQYARSKRRDQIETRQAARVLGTLFFWHYDLPIRLRSGLFLAGFLVFWAAAAARLARLVRRRAAGGWILGISAACALLFLGSVLAEAIQRSRERPGVVVAAEVTARKGDSLSFEPSFTEPLHSGTEFRRLEQRNDWLQIEIADGRRCWIPAAAAELVR